MMLQIRSSEYMAGYLERLVELFWTIPTRLSESMSSLVMLRKLYSLERKFMLKGRAWDGVALGTKTIMQMSSFMTTEQTFIGRTQ